MILRNDKFEVVDSFRYLGDLIGQSGTVLRQRQTEKVAWKNFHSLLLVLTNSRISLKVRGYAYNTCIRSVLLYASETWALK